MIVTENITINEKEFIKTYSDSGYKIERDGIRYSEAIDLVGSSRTYTETDEPIIPTKINGRTTMRAKAHAYDILTGEVNT